MKKLLILMFLLMASGTLAFAQVDIASLAQQAFNNESAAPAQSVPMQLGEFTWGKNQFAMICPPGCEIVQETDSIIRIEAPDLNMYIAVEDRSIVSEESCAEFLLDQCREFKARSLDEPYFNMKERSTGAWLLCEYPDEDAGVPYLMAQGVFVDRTSRRIFTVGIFCSHMYDAVIRDIICSPSVMPDPIQY